MAAATAAAEFAGERSGQLLPDTLRLHAPPLARQACRVMAKSRLSASRCAGVHGWQISHDTGHQCLMAKREQAPVRARCAARWHHTVQCGTHQLRST